VPLPLPNLDDLPYAELVTSARASIPALAPNWTNHNPSDPGIVLVELLAWLTEMLSYRINQVPDDSYRAFLALLGSETPASDQPQSDLETAIRNAVLALRTPYRAASAGDYEYLATVAWSASGAAGTWRVRTARCFPDWNLDPPSARAPGHISLVIVPDAPAGASTPQPPSEMCAALRDWLTPRRLIGTQLHVVGWSPVAVGVAGEMVLRADYAPGDRARRFMDNRTVAEDARRQASAALQQYVSPFTGGADGRGWPLGRDVYLSEIYAVLSRLPGVDHVDISLSGPSSQATEFVPMKPNELPVVLLAAGFSVRVSGNEERARG
jgi:hypothetical protein